MDRASRYEDHVARSDRHFSEQVLQRDGLDGALNFSARCGRLEAVNNRCAGRGMQHVPELCFAQLALLVLGGIVIVWVNLYRKFGIGIDELGEEWKTMAEDGYNLRAEQIFPVFLHELA